MVLKSYLVNRQQFTCIADIRSTSLIITCGVPQGSVLGPLLFLIFINDIDDDVISKLCKFVDDKKVGRAVGSEEEVNKLRNDLKKLCEWAKEWQMLFNVDKCVVIHFGMNNKRAEYIMEGNRLKQSGGERDLGVIISSSEKPSEQCLAAAKKQIECWA